jgi:hypothetical protein
MVVHCCGLQLSQLLYVLVGMSCVSVWSANRALLALWICCATPVRHVWLLMLACSLALLVTRVHFLGVGRHVCVLSTSVYRIDLYSTAESSGSPVSSYEVLV